jgi:hypothetical protein
MKRFLRTSVGLSILCLVVPVARAAEPLQYNRDIRPILAENCFPCHGPDSAARKAGLRLDQREQALQMEAVVPGQPDKSTLVERILSEERGKAMPPAKTKKKLTAAQKDMLKRWIAQGAEYQLHWSLIAPKRPQPPAVKNAAWIRNPIDNFVLADLEKRGLQPAPEADRRTLARRLSLDLTGLPPAPADVEAFVNDRSPNAYELYVDRLLESPHWGEHRGRYWLDAARYADSHGIHFDNYRENWAFRDWVIQAFNRNMTFDRFTIEQLAGDLLPNRTLDQVVASGFNRCNITTNEGGAINEEYLVLYTRDRTETTSQVWLGLTTGCCVCHDHKFDPLTMKDFYSMAAFFNNTTQAAMDGNVKDTPPVVTVPKAEDRPRWETIEHDLAELRKQADTRKQAARADFDKWLKEAKPETVAATVPTDGLKVYAPLVEGKGKSVHFNIDGKPQPITAAADLAWDKGHLSDKAYKSQPNNVLSIADVGDFDTRQPFSFGAWVKLPRNNMTGAIFARMDEPPTYRGWDFWIEGNKPGTHIIHQWQEDAVKVISNTALKANQWHHIFITYDGTAKAAGIKVYIDGKPQPTGVQADGLRNTIRTTVPFKLAQRHQSSRLDVAIQDLRIYTRALSPAEVNSLGRSTHVVTVLKKPADKRTDAEKNELFDWYLASQDQAYVNITRKQGELQQDEVQVKSRGTVAYVMQEKPQEAMAYVLFRGEYDKRRDPVKPATPKVLPPMPAELPHNRLGLAQWLLRPEHPLTARVTVNRFWQELFGTGLVRTSGDFGVSGELPSHPELLDWLAVEFREGNWDVKRFFKLLVMSATYRQSALATPEKLEKDPQNRLLSRGPRFRMDAEMVRDYALAASGLLVRKLGGPSVKPYQPEGVWEAVAMIGSDTRDYRRDNGDKLYRRSMYTFWKRAAPPASMEIFNAPNRETCAVRRERTNTPLQALVTLNDPQFIEAARMLAQTGIKSQESGVTSQDEKVINFFALRLMARPLRAEEMKVVQASLVELLAYYRSHAEDAKKLLAVGETKADASIDPATLAAWTMLANEMMNLDEVLNK